MSLVEDLLGCPLAALPRSFWAVKLKDPDAWMCEARVVTDIARGEERLFDWSLDLVATGDVLRVKELWLFCPPSITSPLGNTARLTITDPGTAFQFKVGTAHANGIRQVEAHIIGRVLEKEEGSCECFIWDTAQNGLITPNTPIWDSATRQSKRDAAGNLVFAGKTSVYDFHSWRPDSLAPLGRLELETLGVKL